MPSTGFVTITLSIFPSFLPHPLPSAPGGRNSLPSSAAPPELMLLAARTRTWTLVLQRLALLFKRSYQPESPYVYLSPLPALPGVGFAGQSFKGRARTPSGYCVSLPAQKVWLLSFPPSSTAAPAHSQAVSLLRGPVAAKGAVGFPYLQVSIRLYVISKSFHCLASRASRLAL